MSTANAAQTFSFVAHIRRLSAAGSVLYIRIDNSDISRLGLRHGQAIEIDFGSGRIAGIVKTSGGSPWLAPPPGGSNAAITIALRGVRFEHGMDVSVTARSLNSGPGSTTAINIVPTRAVVREPFLSRGHSGLRISTKDAVQAIRDYNGGSYRGRRNIELDREAYKRFGNGLPNNLEQLIDQIAFVGEEYGGAQGRFLPHGIRAEAALIADNLHVVMGRWHNAVTNAESLIVEVPDESTLGFLFSPFAATKHWGVWASKTLHFLRPDTFPILDSNAKKALGLKTLGGSSRDYQRFSSDFREGLLSNSDSLSAARIEDSGESPTDLKLMDKILYQLGLCLN
jgi:hypothetical protein